jgi:hypothetical protein
MRAEVPMQDKRALAPWIKRFLLEYLPADRNFARNTQHSYRDALRLFVIFASATLPKKPDELLVEDLAADLLRRFLCHIEERRKCSVATRNQRLAALRTLAAFIGERSPEHLSWCAQIPSIPFKKSGQRPVGYLEKARSTRCSLPLTAPVDSDQEITRCCCFCTTPEPEPTKRPS